MLGLQRAASGHWKLVSSELFSFGRAMLLLLLKKSNNILEQIKMI